MQAIIEETDDKWNMTKQESLRKAEKVEKQKKTKDRPSDKDEVEEIYKQESVGSQSILNGEGVNCIEPEDDWEVTKCDFVCCAPKWLQGFRNVTMMLLCLFWCAFTQSMLSVGIMKSVLTSLERRYGLTSIESGAIITSNAIGSFLFLLPVTYFGGKTRRLRFFSFCMIIMSIGSFIFSVPHFTVGHYKYMASTEPVCHRRENVSYENMCKFQENNMHPRFYKGIFWLSSLLIGIGATPLYLLCLLYIDENSDMRQSSLYIGGFYGFTVLGSVVGYFISSILLQKSFVDIRSTHPHLTSADKHSWIGAWWIGFPIAGVMCLLAVPTLFSFPRELPRTAKRRLQKPFAAAVETESASEALVADDGHLGMRLGCLITNPTFVCLGLSGFAANVVISGMAAFGPKYLEVMFHYSSGEAALVFGLVLIPVSAGGTMIGGILVHRFDLSVMKTLQLQSLLSLLLPPLLLFAFLAPCGLRGETERWAGMTAPYQGEPATASGLNSSCNSGCQCSDHYLFFSPICAVDGVNYFSRCYAGCDVDDVNENSCTCLKHVKQAGANVRPINAPCKRPCRHAPLFLLPFGAAMLITFSIATPRLTSTLRSVPEKQQSFALAVHWLVVRLLGSIPGPVVVGAAFDATCDFWKRTCRGRGSCYLHDVNLLKYILMSICVAAQTFVSVTLLLAWCFYRSAKARSHPPRDRVISIKLQEQPPEANDACNSNVVPHRESTLLRSLYFLFS